MGAISLARDLRDGKTKSAFDVLRVRGPVKLVPCEKHSVSFLATLGECGADSRGNTWDMGAALNVAYGKPH